MAAIGGVILRFFNLGLRVLQVFDSAVILGIFSYYLALLADHNLPIPTWTKAVEGLSGAATLYALLGCLFTCCLGGMTFFAFVGMLLDVCFVGAMIAIAVLTRDGTQSCHGNVHSPLGSGPSNADSSTTKINLGFACRLEKACFAVSIIGIFLFLVSILFQHLLARHHRREKRYGPSPANGYTSGKGRGGFFSDSGSSRTRGDDSLLQHPTPKEAFYRSV